MIGKAVSELAVDKGHQVTVLSRREHLPAAGEKWEIKQWDGKDAIKLAEIIHGCDAVINLAGESIGKGRWTPQRKELLLKSRLEPALALVKAFETSKNPPDTLIQASAVGFYGTQAGEKDETSSAGEDYLAGFALRWEDSTKALDERGVRRVVIRSGMVLKKGAGVLQQLMLPFRLFVGGPMGSGKQIYSWIHIQDEAEAILYLLENKQCKAVYNLTAPSPLSNAEIGKTLGKVMKRPYWIPVPGFALKLVLGEMSTLVLDGQYVVPKRLQDAGFKFKFPELEGALKNLLVEKKYKPSAGIIHRCINKK